MPKHIGPETVWAPLCSKHGTLEWCVYETEQTSMNS